MKILLVYPPFCTPASPPYSITNLHSKLEDSEVLDLNLEFHKLKFPIYEEYYQKGEWKDYDLLTTEYHRKTSITYAKNNRKVINGKKPEFFDILLEKIKEKKADIVAFSVVYSSQVFYTHAFLKELKNTVVGGPAVNKKLIDLTDKTLDIPNTNLPLEFKQDDYFVPKPVIPIKTSSTCFYRGCTFCTHYNDEAYCEYDLEIIKQTIVNSKQRYFFLIDDMIPTKRLLDIAKMMKPLDVKWTCQLRPTNDLNYEVLKELKESGLSFIIWGIESASDRILKLMNKGTNKKDIAKVLEDSHKAGIKNMTYILFGFPTETKEEFLETIEFLEKNEENIDLVLTSIFGLQKGSDIYNNPKKFGITEIIEEKRTLLDPKISYKIKEGLTQKEARELRHKYKKTIEKINKYPKNMNFFREHILYALDTKIL